jgi:hypothetical protein
VSKKVEDLRAVLFDVIAGVRDGSVPLDRAKVIAELTQVVVNTAKTEVEFIKATNGKGVASGFLGDQPPEGEDKPLPEGITGRTVHRIGDQEPDQE